jgi:hypothetical protein
LNFARRHEKMLSRPGEHEEKRQPPGYEVGEEVANQPRTQALSEARSGKSLGTRLVANFINLIN